MDTAMKQLTVAVLATFLCAGAGAADDKMELKSETDRASYAIGNQIGEDFKRQHMELNGAAVTRGIADAQKGAPPLMTEEAMRTTLIELKRKVVAQERSLVPEIDKTAGAERRDQDTQDAAKAQSHARRMAPQGDENAQTFFAENAKKEGIVTLPSGVQYKVLKEGVGRQPKSKDKVGLIYRGTMVNGTEFGNTNREGKPETRIFQLDSLVPGLREAVSQMKEGAQWQVFVPPQLGFNASTPLYRKITVFDIQLASVVSD